MKKFLLKLLQVYLTIMVVAIFLGIVCLPLFLGERYGNEWLLLYIVIFPGAIAFIAGIADL